MAAANLTTHLPILQVMNRANTAPLTLAQPEAASQTFKYGTPVSAVSGYVQAWSGTVYASIILGIAETPGQNLASAGLGAPSMPFGPATGTLAQQTYGFVPNEPNAVNIALGTPAGEGRTLFISADSDNTFEAVFDNSTGTVAANWTPTQAMINTSAGQLGLSVDTNGFWYVDGGKTGASAVVQVVGVNPIDGFTLNARVRFKFLSAAIQVV